MSIILGINQELNEYHQFKFTDHQWIYDSITTWLPELNEKVDALKDAIDAFKGTYIEILPCVKYNDSPDLLREKYIDSEEAKKKTIINKLTFELKGLSVKEASDILIQVQRDILKNTKV